MSRSVVTGSIDQSIRVWAYDSDGAAITGEAYNSAGISVSVVVRSAGRIVSTTALTLVARSSVGVHRDSAFTEVSGGEYVVDLPDSYSATAERDVSVTLTSTAISDGYVLSETLSVGAGSLSGPYTRTVTVTDSNTSVAIQNAKVRLYRTGETGTELTNVSGVASFTVEAATWSYAITATGYTGASGAIAVSANGDTAIELDAATVTPPTNPALCAVIIHVRDQYGVDIAGQPVEITFVKWDATAVETPPVLSIPPVQTTDSGGLVQVNLYRLAVYKIIYGESRDARRWDGTIPDAGSYEVEL